VAATTLQKLGPRAREFFLDAMKLLDSSGIPFLVGGAYAYGRYTGIERHTRDFDVFVHPRDTERTLALFAAQGYRVELLFPHWLGKIYKGRAYVDVIFSSGNGVATVDEAWFEHAVEHEVLGRKTLLVPVEEMIWSKAFIMERERFDGADVLHLLLARADELDWKRLLDRFGAHQLVLLSHLTNFIFVFPAESSRVPPWVWERLIEVLRDERSHAPDAGPVCRGTLLSRTQYLAAIEKGFRDARLPPDGCMERRDLAVWTAAAVGEDRCGVPASRIAESARELGEG
jgi:hypothetical protein